MELQPVSTTTSFRPCLAAVPLAVGISAITFFISRLLKSPSNGVSIPYHPPKMAAVMQSLSQPLSLSPDKEHSFEEILLYGEPSRCGCSPGSVANKINSYLKEGRLNDAHSLSHFYQQKSDPIFETLFHALIEKNDYPSAIKLARTSPRVVNFYVINNAVKRGRIDEAVAFAELAFQERAKKNNPNSGCESCFFHSLSQQIQTLIKGLLYEKDYEAARKLTAVLPQGEDKIQFMQNCVRLLWRQEDTEEAAAIAARIHEESKR